MSFLFGNDEGNDLIKIENEKLALVDVRVAAYEKAKMAQVDQTVTDYRRERFLEVEKDAVKCLDDLSKSEHDFHQKKQDQAIEIEKLNGQIENAKLELDAIKSEGATIKALEAEVKDLQKLTYSYKAEAEAAKAVIDAKQEQIKMLDDNNKVLVGKLVTLNLDKVVFDVSAPVKIVERAASEKTKREE